MNRTNNYALAAENAKKIFLSYDQPALIQKLALSFDDAYLYTSFLGAPYRIERLTGNLERQKDGVWVDGNSFDEVLSICDLVCDSKEIRTPSGIFKPTAEFGRNFHQTLTEGRDPLAEFAQKSPSAFRARLLALGGRETKGADLAFVLPVFDSLELCLHFWFADEEFAPSLRILWDANALQYIRYETMYYVIDCLRARLEEK